MKNAEVLQVLINSTEPSGLPALAGDFARALAEVLARISSGTLPPLVPETPPSALTVADAALRLGVSESWLYRHSKELPFARKLGHRTLRFESVGLERWLKAQESR